MNRHAQRSQKPTNRRATPQPDTSQTPVKEGTKRHALGAKNPTPLFYVERRQTGTPSLHIMTNSRLRHRLVRPIQPPVTRTGTVRRRPQAVTVRPQSAATTRT